MTDKSFIVSINNHNQNGIHNQMQHSQSTQQSQQTTFNQYWNASQNPQMNGNIIQNNYQYDPHRFQRGGNTNYFTNISNGNQTQMQPNQINQMHQYHQHHMNGCTGYTYSNTNDLPFHYLHAQKLQQTQTSSMPKVGIQTIRETPISVRDFGVDDDEFENEFDEFEDDEYECENDDFDDEFDNENGVDAADEIFQEVIETVEELKKIGDKNNQILSHMIKGQK